MIEAASQRRVGRVAGLFVSRRSTPASAARSASGRKHGRLRGYCVPVLGAAMPRIAVESIAAGRVDRKRLSEAFDSRTATTVIQRVASLAWPSVVRPIGGPLECAIPRSGAPAGVRLPIPLRIDRKRACLHDPRGEFALAEIESEVRHDPLTGATARICYPALRTPPAPELPAIAAEIARESAVCAPRAQRPDAALPGQPGARRAAASRRRGAVPEPVLL